MRLMCLFEETSELCSAEIWNHQTSHLMVHSQFYLKLKWNMKPVLLPFPSVSCSGIPIYPQAPSSVTIMQIKFFSWLNQILKASDFKECPLFPFLFYICIFLFFNHLKDCIYQHLWHYSMWYLLDLFLLFSE